MPVRALPSGQVPRCRSPQFHPRGRRTVNIDIPAAHRPFIHSFFLSFIPSFLLSLFLLFGRRDEPCRLVAGTSPRPCWALPRPSAHADPGRSTVNIVQCTEHPVLDLMAACTYLYRVWCSPAQRACGVPFRIQTKCHLTSAQQQHLHPHLYAHAAYTGWCSVGLYLPRCIE